MIKNKKQMFIVIGVFTLVMLLGSVTYAFFNYTRTGASNIIKTGKISFSTGQTDTIILTNVFPISRSELSTDTDNSDEVIVTITGDTTYENGVEYLITTDSTNAFLGENNDAVVVPIGVEIIPEKTGNLGEATTSVNEYFSQRGGNTSYYLNLKNNLNNDNPLKNSILAPNEHLLLGYIAPGETGINGTIGIKAYLDKDKIAISDTYPEKTYYALNDNLSSEQISMCMSILSSINPTEDFCRGTGTVNRYGKNYTLKEAVESGWIINNNKINELVANGIINILYADGTANNWVNRRTVLSTSEWNSLANTPLSFKVKVEANEGTWIEFDEVSIEIIDEGGYYLLKFNAGDSDFEILTSFFEYNSSFEIGECTNNPESNIEKAIIIDYKSIIEYFNSNITQLENNGISINDYSYIPKNSFDDDFSINLGRRTAAMVVQKDVCPRIIKILENADYNSIMEKINNLP